MYYVAVEARVHKMLRSGGGGRCSLFNLPLDQVRHILSGHLFQAF